MSDTGLSPSERRVYQSMASKIALMQMPTFHLMNDENKKMVLRNCLVWVLENFRPDVEQIVSIHLNMDYGKKATL